MESNTQADFPLIYRDFVKMFPDVAACASYLERLRWPDGFLMHLPTVWNPSFAK